MITICKAYKVELDPNKEQITAFKQHCGAARFTYNWGLQYCINSYKSGVKKRPNSIDLHKELVKIKKEQYPWMYESSKCAPQGSLRDLDQAYNHFFRKCRLKKQGKFKGNPGFPKFKSKKRGLGGFYIENPNPKGMKVELGRIKLPNIGWVQLKEHDYIPTNVIIKSVHIKEHAGHWFVSVPTKQENNVQSNQGPTVGLDLGLTSFTTDSDGNKTTPPKPLKKSLKKLQRVSRQHSRKQKGSNNRTKSRKKLARLHYKIANQRKDFLHKESTKLAKTKSVICVEDLAVQNMVKNRKLSRNISDVGWGMFVSFLAYKCLWYGSELVMIDRFFPSSKTCFSCGNIKEKMDLSERVYKCGVCGLFLDRDLNAAENILKEGLRIREENTVSSTEIQACGDLVRPESLRDDGTDRRSRNRRKSML